MRLLLHQAVQSDETLDAGSRGLGPLELATPTETYEGQLGGGSCQSRLGFVAIAGSEFVENVPILPFGEPQRGETSLFGVAANEQLAQDRSSLGGLDSRYAKGSRLGQAGTERRCIASREHGLESR